MNYKQAAKKIKEMDLLGKYVFAITDLRKLFPEDSHKTFTEGLRRLVKNGLLVRAFRGIYVNSDAVSKDDYVLEHIALTLRRGEYNYVSLESALSEYGLISQIPLDCITVMTTGRKGYYHTTYGAIEFVHTKRSSINIVNGIVKIANRPMRIASKHTALRDLRRVGRNLNMVDEGMLDED